MFINTIYGRVKCYDDDAISKQIRSYGNHTRPEFAFATSILNLGDSVFDIGAHVGTFLFPARHRAGAVGKLLAIEGNWATYEYLQDNIARFKYKNVSALHALVGNGIDRFDYVTTSGNTGAACGIKSDKGQFVSVSLDSLVADYFQPNFIKIDVEGHEYAVLSSSQYVLNNAPAIYMEIVPSALERAGASVDLINGFLLDIGYSFYINIGRRNWRSDLFKVRKIDSLLGRNFFDVLCVKKDSAYDEMLTFVAS